MILAKDIRKEFAGQDVLRGINLSVDENDFVVILGASGSGKSTLLNILSGLEKSDSGEVLYNGENISNYTETQLTEFRRKNIGFVFQQYYLLNNSDCSEILRELGLEDKVEKYPNELSGGEQQRVSIARALAKKPKVLFLDEPTGALDEETGRGILEYIFKLRNESKFTMIMVTHNENIAQIANKIVHVKSGKVSLIEENSTPKTVAEIGW